MKKNYKKLILAILILNLLNGCQALKDGLEGNKKSKSAEEFLIQKKNPLVLPPVPSFDCNHLNLALVPS